MNPSSDYHLRLLHTDKYKNEERLDYTVHTNEHNARICLCQIDLKDIRFTAANLRIPHARVSCQALWLLVRKRNIPTEESLLVGEVRGMLSGQRYGSSRLLISVL
jgi:hypothetical protein